MSDTLFGVLIGRDIALLGQLISLAISRTDRRRERLVLRSESLIDELISCKAQWQSDSQNTVAAIDSLSAADRFAFANDAESSAKLLRLLLERLRFSIQDRKVQDAIGDALVKISYSNIRTRIAAAIAVESDLMTNARTSVTDSIATINGMLDIVAENVAPSSSWHWWRTRRRA